MKPRTNLPAKSTKDYPRPCRGSQLMGSQEMAFHEAWPKAHGYPPRLSGLMGCATGRKNAAGEDTREAGPIQQAQDAIIDLVEADELADVLPPADAPFDDVDAPRVWPEL